MLKLKEVKNTRNGDLVIKYKVKQSLNKLVDKKIENCLKPLGYKWIGSGFDIQENIRDIQFHKE